MATTPVRQTTKRIANRTVKAKLEELHHPEYEIQFTFVDTSDDCESPETWVYGVTDDREAELLRSSEIDDLLAEPDPPEWVQRAFETWEIEVK